jgi:uncharacterized repeat protein (TIGR01451 family)
MKKFAKLLSIIFLLVSTSSFAQNFINAYTDQNQTGYLGFMNRIATDNFNNVVNTSTFTGTVEVDGQNYSSLGGLSSLIIKKDDNGAVLWAKSLACNGTTIIGGIYIDNQSNIYVTGMFGDTLNATLLNCQPFPISNSGGIRAFIVKYAPNGNVLWSNSIMCSTSGSSGNADLYRITGNGSDRIAISAAFENVGPQTVGSSTVSPAVGNVLIAFCDDNGNWLNAKVLSGPNNTQLSMSLAMNNNAELFIGGVFKGSMDLDAAGILTTPPSDLNDFIIKLNANGDFEWAHALPLSSWWRTEVMVYQNDVFLTGSFGGTVTIGSTSLTSTYISTYLTRLDNAGNFLWAKKYGDAEANMYCANIKNDIIYICGKTSEFSTSNTFDTYNLVYANTLPSAPNQNTIAYIIKMDLNGIVFTGACYGFSFSTLNTTGIAASLSKAYLTGNVGGGAQIGGYLVTGAQINGANYVAVYTDSANIISGNSFYDANSNGMYDAGELHCPVNLSLSNGTNAVNTLINGNYLIGVGPGTYTSAITNPPMYYNYSPSGYTSVFSTLSSEVDSNKNFAFQPIPNQSDLLIDLVTGFFRPGFNGVAYVTLNNIGTTTESGVIDLLLNHPEITINLITPAAASTSGNAAILNYNLNPGESIIYVINYYVSVNALIGNTFQSTVSATNINDLTPLNNSKVLNSIITGSYDPNVKEVSSSVIFPDFVNNNESLEYIIHFQNTGNDTAFTILIIDTLSNYFDLSTLEIVSSSHPVMVNNYNGVLWFRFNHINLPDSNTNEMLSHGFVKYKLKLNSSINIGSTINNTAYIYFDFNEAIVTNTTSTYYSTVSSSKNNFQNNIGIYPNPVIYDYININSDEVINKVELLDITGKTLSIENGNGMQTKKFELRQLAKGVYIVKVITTRGVFEQRLIKQ